MATTMSTAAVPKSAGASVNSATMTKKPTGGGATVVKPDVIVDRDEEAPATTTTATRSGTIVKKKAATASKPPLANNDAADDRKREPRAPKVNFHAPSLSLDLSAEAIITLVTRKTCKRRITDVSLSTSCLLLHGALLHICIYTWVLEQPSTSIIQRHACTFERSISRTDKTFTQCHSYNVKRCKPSICLIRRVNIAIELCT